MGRIRAVPYRHSMGLFNCGRSGSLCKLFILVASSLCVLARGMKDGRLNASKELSEGPLIQGGTPAERNEFSFMVSLRSLTLDQHLCGGALISKDMVVTAAHCVDPHGTKDQAQPFLKDYVQSFPNLVIGSRLLRVGDDPNAERRETCAQIVHRKWNGNAADGYDIAVLILNESSTKTPIKMNRGVRLLEGLKFITIGFGTQGGSVLPSVLQKITVDFIPNYNCAKIAAFREILTKKMLCAKAGAQRGPCQGDSGGPLIAGKPVPFLVGITSFGNCDTYNPEVYTRVAEFVDWIQNIAVGVDPSIGDFDVKCSGGCLMPLTTNFSCQITEDATVSDPPPAPPPKSENDGLNLNFSNLDLNLPTGIDQELLDAAEAGNLAAVIRALNDGANVDVMNLFHKTALHIAAEMGHLEIVKELLKAGATVDFLLAFGYNTALCLSSRKGHLDIVKVLIEAGADVNRNTWWLNNYTFIEGQYLSGCLAIFDAAENGHIEIVEELVNAGADIHLKDGFGRPLLIRTAWFGHAKVVRFLLAEGANATAQNLLAETPLHYAATTLGAPSETITNDLLNAGANVKEQDKDGYTPLHRAAYYGNLGVVEILLMRDADKSITNRFDERAFDVICKCLEVQNTLLTNYIECPIPGGCSVAKTILDVSNMLS